MNMPIEQLREKMIADFGVELEDGTSKFAVVRSGEDRKSFQVILNEGRNRQIRRTFAALGYRVVKLHRIQFGRYQLAGLEPGKYEEVKKY